MPTAASSTARAADVPAPFAAAFTPMISGMMNAALNTGPMNPTDCASTSISESFLPPRRSYSSVTTNGRSPSTDPSPPTTDLLVLPTPAGLRRPAPLGPLEPHVHLTRAYRGLVLAEPLTRCDAGPPAQLSRHHQVVAEVPLRIGLAVLGHPVDHARVVALLELGEHLHVRVVVGAVVDVVRSLLALALGQVLEVEEPVGHPARGEQHDASVALLDRLPDQLAEQEEVVGVAALVQRHAQPGRVRIAQERPDVHGAVEDREVGIVTGEDPTVIPPFRLRLDKSRELGIAWYVVRDLAHAARQLAAREPSLPAVVARHEVLPRRLPVRVEHDHRVGLQPVEVLLHDAVQARDQSDLLALIVLEPPFLRQHD